MREDEETLAALSGELHVDVEFEVTPWVKKPPTKKKQSKKLTREQLLDAIDNVMDPNESRNDFTNSNLPSYKVTARTIIFGKEYTQIYTGIRPGNISGIKQDIEDRIHWYVKELLESKRIGQGGIEQHKLKVQIP